MSPEDCVVLPPLPRVMNLRYVRREQKRVAALLQLASSSPATRISHFPLKPRRCDLLTLCSKLDPEGTFRDPYFAMPRFPNSCRCREQNDSSTKAFVRKPHLSFDSLQGQGHNINQKLACDALPEHSVIIEDVNWNFSLGGQEIIPRQETDGFVRNDNLHGSTRRISSDSGAASAATTDTDLFQPDEEHRSVSGTGQAGALGVAGNLTDSGLTDKADFVGTTDNLSDYGTVLSVTTGQSPKVNPDEDGVGNTTERSLEILFENRDPSSLESSVTTAEINDSSGSHTSRKMLRRLSQPGETEKKSNANLSASDFRSVTQESPKLKGPSRESTGLSGFSASISSYADSESVWSKITTDDELLKEEHLKKRAKRKPKSRGKNWCTCGHKIVTQEAATPVKVRFSDSLAEGLGSQNPQPPLETEGSTGSKRSGRTLSEMSGASLKTPIEEQICSCCNLPVPPKPLVITSPPLKRQSQRLLKQKGKGNRTLVFTTETSAKGILKRQSLKGDISEEASWVSTEVSSAPDKDSSYSQSIPRTLTTLSTQSKPVTEKAPSNSGIPLEKQYFKHQPVKRSVPVDIHRLAYLKALAQARTDEILKKKPSGGFGDRITNPISFSYFSKLPWGGKRSCKSCSDIGWGLREDIEQVKGRENQFSSEQLIFGTIKRDSYYPGGKKGEGNFTMSRLFYPDGRRNW